MTNNSGQDWSREEVEATVADYFDMLGKELKGVQYNKAEHNRSLARLLDSRSHGSIERKHQNISAILRCLRFPFIEGYKPLGNYQHLLYEVVAERLKNSSDLIQLVENQVNQPARLPDIDDILSSLVDPPVMEPIKAQFEADEICEPITSFRVDYFEKEAHNRSLGLAGEKYVLLFEQARLIAIGQESLASKVKHISLEQGDGTGFDILSFEGTGQERLIEVKTTSYGCRAPFFVTRNELVVSKREFQHYYLYRVFGFRHQPKLFYKQGSLEESFHLDPTEYMARVG